MAECGKKKITQQKKRRFSGILSLGKATSIKILETYYIIKWLIKKFANIRQSTITLIMDYQIRKNVTIYKYKWLNN